MGLATEWHEGLVEAIREFGRSRRVGSPVVQIVLDDGEAFFIQTAQPGPGDELVTLAVYPDVRLGPEVLDALVRDDEGELHTPRVVIVHPGRVQRIELLARAPGEGAQPIGFTGAD